MKNKTAVISGASRGIGAAMARRLAEDYNVVILAKTSESHPKLPGTIYTVAEEIEALGGNALALQVDVRFEVQVKNAIMQAVDIFGGIDVLINNASAVILKPTAKQIHLMKQVIVDGTRFCTEACLPYFMESKDPHVLNIAPLLPMEKHWVQKYGPYAKAKRAIGKYTANMVQQYHDIAWHTLWPAKMVYTSATIALFGEEEARKHTRSSEMMADATKMILESDIPYGSFWLDEWVLKDLGGVTDFSRYLLPGSKEEDLMPDVFV